MYPICICLFVCLSVCLSVCLKKKITKKQVYLFFFNSYLLTFYFLLPASTPYITLLGLYHTYYYHTRTSPIPYCTVCSVLLLHSSHASLFTCCCRLLGGTTFPIIASTATWTEKNNNLDEAAAIIEPADPINRHLQSTFIG